MARIAALRVMSWWLVVLETSVLTSDVTDRCAYGPRGSHPDVGRGGDCYPDPSAPGLDRRVASLGPDRGKTSGVSAASARSESNPLLRTDT
jgi:hypothetical protein